MTDYLNWRSDLKIEQVFAEGESFSYPTLLDDAVIFLTTLKDQGSRQALVIRNEGPERCLTPPLYDLRTRISEYGGKPYWFLGGHIYFANNQDQCLYRQLFADGRAGEPRRLTAECMDGKQMYTDLSQIDDHTFVAIVEQHSEQGENQAFIAAIVAGEEPAQPQAIQSGADFYSNLVIDCVRSRMAWVQWDHPNMPWDSVELWLADFSLSEGLLKLSNQQRVSLEQNAAVCQLIFAANGRLFFAADFAGFEDQDAENYWNLYCLEPDLRISLVSNMTMEFGYPHWQYGDARIVQYDNQSLAAVASDVAHDEVYLIDQDTLSMSCLKKFSGHVQNLYSDGKGAIALVARGDSDAPQLLKIELQPSVTTVLANRPAPIKKADISHPRHLVYPCADGGESFGFYYPPVNARYQNDGPPPLLVMVHGGPTARSYGFFDIQKQFWTNRGFAIFDVNHRGSCGYGRRYRDALYGHWGEIDSRDIVDGVDYLVQRELANPEQVCIRGKSAGGYAVLRALCSYPEVFRVGACYYGIGNLRTLAEMTHKFERYYTDRLIGEEYRPERAEDSSSLYYQRSPIHQISNVRAAMIIFQGLLDNIVPPMLAQEVVAVLESSGIKHRYIEYADEGHGFRHVRNNIDAWSRELEFYREVLTG